jgi:hypothetical protein
VPDAAVFRFTVPLRAEEFLILLGIWPAVDFPADPAPQKADGWALVDAQDHVWGWHRVEPRDMHWCDAESALDAFIVEPNIRAHLVGDGFRVVADDGALLEEIVRTTPWYGLPPLPSGPSERPSEPILPHWGNLLDLALAAVSPRGGVHHVGSVIEDLIQEEHPEFRRPAVFDRTIMGRWLDSADAPAAISATRVAAGWADNPTTCAEAKTLLDPLGCTRLTGGEHTVDVHLSEGSPDGDWSIGTCNTCWHPVLMNESPLSSGEPPTVWALFGDLR